MYKKLLSTLLLTGALSVQAAVPSAVGKIQGISAYDSFGGGDVLIKFPTQVSNCLAGVYIPPKSGGEKKECFPLHYLLILQAKTLSFRFMKQQYGREQLIIVRLKLLSLSDLTKILTRIS
ncbi:hypothetical protein P3339_08330 [Microbulbifer sp. MLAF003]|uniref:hypothetical protein n=1 Tax=Microbulbifer sp. MLAF003 TaxID=3032582 RepID=UPI0024AD8650|nr:hypothetical protein [Microbulbifer sp. MLAF003]WHI52755.1 hypothetical protein P3339_08330 [Microbulbifer sp. MLAF003]